MHGDCCDTGHSSDAGGTDGSHTTTAQYPGEGHGPPRHRLAPDRRRRRGPLARAGGGIEPPRGPGITDQPQYDNTDVYAFVSPDDPDTVTLIANWIPFEEPAGGPNFYPFADDARYDIHIDNDGDAQGRPDLPLDLRTTARKPADSFSGRRSSTTTGRSPRSTTRT